MNFSISGSSVSSTDKFETSSTEERKEVSPLKRSSSSVDVTRQVEISSQSVLREQAVSNTKPPLSKETEINRLIGEGNRLIGERDPIKKQIDMDRQAISRGGMDAEELKSRNVALDYLIKEFTIRDNKIRGLQNRLAQMAIPQLSYPEQRDADTDIDTDTDTDLDDDNDAEYFNVNPFLNHHPAF